MSQTIEPVPKYYDSVIIGAGIYGMLNAIYAKARGETVLILERHPSNRKFNIYRLDHNVVSALEKVQEILTDKGINSPLIDGLLEKSKENVAKNFDEKKIFLNTINAEDLVAALNDSVRLLGIEYIAPTTTGETLSVTKVDGNAGTLSYSQSADPDKSSTVACSNVMFSDGARTTVLELVPDLFKREESDNIGDSRFNYSVSFEITDPNIDLTKLFKKENTGLLVKKLAAGGSDVFVPATTILLNGNKITIQGSVPSSFEQVPGRDIRIEDWAYMVLETTLFHEVQEPISHQPGSLISSTMPKLIPFNRSQVQLFAQAGRNACTFFEFRPTIIKPVIDDQHDGFTLGKLRVFNGADAAKIADYKEGGGAATAAVDAEMLDLSLRTDKPAEYVAHVQNKSYPWDFDSRSTFIVNILFRLIHGETALATTNPERDNGVLSLQLKALQDLTQLDKLPAQIKDKLNQIIAELKLIIDYFKEQTEFKISTDRDSLFLTYSEKRDLNIVNEYIELHSGLMTCINNLIPKIGTLRDEVLESGFELQFKELVGRENLGKLQAGLSFWESFLSEGLRVTLDREDVKPKYKN